MWIFALAEAESHESHWAAGSFQEQRKQEAPWSSAGTFVLLYFCLYYLYEAIYMKSVYWLQSRDSYKLLHFPVPTSPDTQDNPKPFALLASSVPNLTD